MALEHKISIDSISMFKFPKFLGGFEWPSLSHMPTFGPIIKGMIYTPSGLLGGKILQKWGVGKRK